MAETFVLVHGGGVGAWSWAAVVRQMEKLGDRALAVDLPGRGENRPDPKTITLSTHVDFVTAFIEDRGLDRVILVAHSMGGTGHHRRGAANSPSHQTADLYLRFRDARRGESDGATQGTAADGIGTDLEETAQRRRFHAGAIASGRFPGFAGFRDFRPGPGAVEGDG
jgi:pimeloyl-ACP methyl ester carboxylesterase